MKNLVLASVLGTTVGVGAVSVAAGGPIWLALTQPQAYYVEVQPQGTPATVAVTPCPFVLTEIVVGGSVAPGFQPCSDVIVRVDGTPVACAGLSTPVSVNYPRVVGVTTFSQGIPVPQGATIDVVARSPTGSTAVPVTLAGYFID